MDELEKALPAGEGMIDAEQGGTNKTPNEFCLNCGTKLLDKFCHHCGQKDIPRRQTLGELWTNFISSFWSYEGKFFQTTRYLLTKPGFLAIEYNAGRRESYYHPARMYAFISFVFFLIFFSFSDSEEIQKDTTKAVADSVKAEQIIDKTAKELKEANVDSIVSAATGDTTLSKIFSEENIDSLKKISKKKKKRKNRENWNFNFSDIEHKTVKAYDSAQALLPEEKRDGWFEHSMKIKAIKLNNKYKDNLEQFGKDFLAAFKDNFSKVLFFLLPFFALTLKLLYIRRGYYYSEHLVFSIYYYNFFYLAGSLQMIFNQFAWLEWLSTLMGFWIFFYLLFAMKKMYGQSWGKTTLKFLIFDFLFMILLSIGFTISAIAIIIFI
jgi:hypothetical protein